MTSVKLDVKRGSVESVPDIIVAALRADNELVLDILKSGGDVNAVDPSNLNTCLHISAFQGNNQLADILLSQSDLNLLSTNSDGLRADQVASIQGFQSLSLKIIRKRQGGTSPGLEP